MKAAKLTSLITLCLSLLALSCTTKSKEVSAPGNGTASSVFTGKINYDDYFTQERLRIDLALAGNSQEQRAYLLGLARESQWVGSPDGLVDPFGYGEYYFEAFIGENVVFSRGFNPLFQEWRSTEQARQVDIAMNQTLWMPFPKDSVRIVLYGRNATSKRLEPFFECTVDPQDKQIAHTPLQMPESLLYNGDPVNKLDLLFIAEGYTADQMDKFKADAQRFTDYLFQYEPYRSRKNDFNIWYLETPSEEEGVDIPQQDQWRNTLCQSSFYTFYVDRYLTVQDHRRIAEAVAATPFDALFIIANETKYGGGGFFNSYSLGTSDNKLSNEVFIHEFGHGFAGLADEYYDAETGYDDDYYPSNVEPWEPNITNLVNFDSKWKDMIAEGTPVPTPNDSAYAAVTGLFEGGGYQSHGIYRPVLECRMKNNTAPAFCPVCQRAIDRMIDFYTR